MSLALVNLPTLGVGASLSLETAPDAAALVRSPGGPDFIEYAGRVDVGLVRSEVDRVLAAGAKVLFHPSYINFCGSFANSPSWLRETAHHIAAVGSPWFAQDLAYCFMGTEHGYSTQFGYFAPPIFNPAGLELAIARVREVAANVPVPILVEPPPLTFVIGQMPLFAFFGELATRADCAILLDVGHLVSYEMASQSSVFDAISALPKERVIELHIAGARIERRGGRDFYIDAHEREIVPRSWQMLDALLPLLPAVKAVCFECEGASEAQVLETLATLRKHIAEHSSNRELVAKVKA